MPNPAFERDCPEAGSPSILRYEQDKARGEMIWIVGHTGVLYDSYAV